MKNTSKDFRYDSLFEWRKCSYGAILFKRFNILKNKNINIRGLTSLFLVDAIMIDAYTR